MGISNTGNNNHYLSNQISRQGQMQLNSMKNPLGGISRQDLTSFKNSSIYAEYKQIRKQENSATNLQSLAQTAEMLRQQTGMNIDVNQLASMYDANGDGLLSGKELQKAETALNNMYMQYTQQNGMMAMGNYGTTGTQYSQAAATGGGGIDVGTAISTLTNGIGSLFGGGEASEAGAAQSGGDSSGNWLSKAGDFVGKLFGG